MSDLVYPVRKGAAYFAGLDLPFLVGAGDVAIGARERGFSQVVVTPRDKARFAFDVRKVPGYSDDWNTAFFGIYEGNAPIVEVPAPPAWLFEVRPQIPPPGQSVVAQVVRPVRPNAIVVRPPSGTRVVLWVTGLGLVVVAAAALLEPVRRRAHA